MHEIGLGLLAAQKIDTLAIVDQLSNLLVRSRERHTGCRRSLLAA